MVRSGDKTEAYLNGQELAFIMPFTKTVKQPTTVEYWTTDTVSPNHSGFMFIKG